MIDYHSELAVQLRTFSGFPSPPTVAVKLVELAKRPDADIQDVVKIVELDSVLTLKILRLANSARYLQRRKSSTVQRALVMMGVNAALTIGLSFSLLESLPASKSDALDHQMFWRRSLLAAISARCLGQLLKSGIEDELFMTALLQDVGMLALANAKPELYREASTLQEHWVIAKYEREQIRFDHAEVTAFLLSNWNLPDRVVSAIAHSHQPSREMARTENERFEGIVAMSGLFADLFIHAQSTAYCDKVTRIAEQLLGLDKTAVGWVLDRIRDAVPETEEMFGMKLAKDPEKLVLQAQQLMQIIEADTDAFNQRNLKPTISQRLEASDRERRRFRRKA